jgi:hypothetical protein
VLRGGVEMNRFEARARQIETRVSPDLLAGHPDSTPSILRIAWLRFRRWVLPTLVLAGGLYAVGFRPAAPETHRLAAIAKEILGSAQDFDDRAVRLRLLDRLALIKGLETLLVPGAEPGLWPNIARVMGLPQRALWDEDRRFELLGKVIEYASSLPVNVQHSTLRLWLLQAVKDADITQLEYVRVIAELPPDLRGELKALSPSEFRVMLAGLNAYQTTKGDRQHLLARLEQSRQEVEWHRSQLLLELTHLEKEQSDLVRKRQETKAKTEELRQNKRK